MSCANNTTPGGVRKKTCSVTEHGSRESAYSGFGCAQLGGFMRGEHFNVVIVGARCAGSPLATFLRRAGLSVCVVDRAGFPSDTLSSHFFQVSGLSVMRELGVLDRVLACGAPPMTNVYMKFEDVD